MRLVRALIVGAAASMFAGSARSDTILEKVAACQTAADRPICLLKATIDDDGGSSIWRDRDLRSAPEILDKLGITAASVAAARGANKSERMFFGSDDEAQAALDEALQLDGTGRPPAEALKPLLELSAMPPSVPLFFAAQGEEPSARETAFHTLLARPGELRRPPSLPLLRLAADALQRETLGLDVRRFRRAAPALAMAYQRLGDEPAVTRVLDALPYRYERIAILADLGRLEPAVAEYLTLRREDVAAGVRADLKAELQRLVRIKQASVLGEPEFLEGEAHAASAQGDADLARMWQRRADAARRAGPPTIRVPEIPAEEIERKTNDAIQDLEQGLMGAAARSGRAEIARPVADRILETPDIHENLWRFPFVLKAAAPERAVAKLEALEASLQAARMAGRLPAVARGWKAIGRPDRVASLIERVRPWAEADRKRTRGGHGYNFALAEVLLAEGRVSEARQLADLPLRDLLKADIAAGRGVANFDAYYAEAATENDRIYLRVECMSDARAARDIAVLAACHEKDAALRPPSLPPPLVLQGAIESAAWAARLGDDAGARQLLQLAFPNPPGGAGPAPTAPEEPTRLSPLDLIAVAKAELRADGRLPPRPKEQTMLGRAP